MLAGETPVLVHNSGGCPPETLIHYTDEAGMNGIVGSKKLNASTKEASPKDARYGDGQYLSDIAPGTKTCGQLSRCFLGHPFSGRRFTNYVEIDVRGLNVVKGRDNVYVIPNQGPLDLNGQIIGYGAN
nr:HYD1 signature containing ADP-ribosyltransferase family protein [Streptomyces sp. TML10]